MDSFLLTVCHPLLHQALESTLAEARSEAAALAQLRDAQAAAADREAGTHMTNLQVAQAGGMLVALPLIQFVYFFLRLLMWMLKAMERMGLH